MSATEPFAQIDLDKLLEHLRLRGVAVGTVELQHLQRVFVRSPQLSHAGLQDLLCSILAKDVTQRQTIVRLYNQLVPFDAEEQGEELVTSATSQRRSTKHSTSDDSATLEEPEQEQPKEPVNIWRLGMKALVLATVLMLAVAGWMSWPDEDDGTHISKPEIKQEVETALPEPKDKPEEKPGDLKLVKYIDLWYPTIEVEKISPWPRLLPPLLLFLGAGLGFVWLLQQALQKTRVRTPKPPQLSKERGRFYVPVSGKQADYHLLSGDERREMSWGIHHYLTDVPLDKLDIKRSVQRSAQTGLPQIEFEQASREREVWLWQEQGSQHPDLVRHIDEIVQTLRPANIAVQRGYFRGLPDRVRDERGETVWSSRHEYPEHQPLVVVFADATRIASAMQQNTDHAAVTLRLLSEWEHLCFVDHQGGLASVLGAHGLTCLLPNAVSGWLAQQGGMQQVADRACALDDIYRWAVACCLPDRVLMEDEIRGLHEHLGLQCAWQFNALQQYAEEFGRGLDFSKTRVERLNAFSRWLRVGDETAGKALDYWLARNREIDQTLTARELEGKQAWAKTRKQQQLLLDRLVLQLWCKESRADAVVALHDMHGEKQLRCMVMQKLRQFSCVGFPLEDAHRGERVVLPWNWAELSAETQQQLLLCGFGGADGKSSRLRLDKATGVVLSLLAGFALAGLVGSVHALLPQDAALEILLNSAKPAEGLIIQEVLPETEQHSERLLLGTYKSSDADIKVRDDDHRLVANWERRVVRAQRSAPDIPDTKIWLAGEKADVLRPADWPGLSLAVIAGDPEGDNEQRLAAHLLDSGSVDRVLIGKGSGWRKVYQKWRKMSDLLERTQWFFVGAKPYDWPPKPHLYAYFDKTPAQLLNRLQADNQRHPVAKWAVAEYVQGEAVLQARKKEKALEILELANGMTLVKIPRGQFEMGSDNGADWEKPVHTVTMNYDFWMSQTEVTFEQYDAYVVAVNSKVVPKPSDYGWGRDKRPVVDVSWDDAQGYVKWLSKTNDESLQCRLPSEAEWEYAARAGTDMAYWWGETASHDYANYGKDECCDGLAEGKDQWENTAPVGQFPANPFGLHDMHGNVYEWVQDCYVDSYTDAPVDGSSQESAKCSSRVLRGGSWSYSPYYLRSAHRFRNVPDGRNDLMGFRIVCPPLPTE